MNSCTSWQIVLFVASITFIFLNGFLFLKALASYRKASSIFFDSAVMRTFIPKDMGDYIDTLAKRNNATFDEVVVVSISYGLCSLEARSE